ncbi:MAG: Molybdate/tungstate-binding protein WtpA [Methanonatronarchaeales archaeon]|nr:Molybdate/tungstate-binding protein WtpA [Methanonatronarchaeales archaeon]
MPGTGRLLLTGALLALLATTSVGCIGVDEPGGFQGRVSVLSAGSLSVLLEDEIGPAFESDTGIEYRGEYHGSRAVMRMVEGGSKRPDVVVSADAGLLRDRLYPGHAEWDVVFASSPVGITYNPETEVGKRLSSGEPWYEVFRETDSKIAMSDPDLDPLGYRTVQMFQLAQGYYGEPGLAEDLARNLVVDPEEAHMLASVETGERVAAVCYGNMATDHGLPFLDLPDEIDFSDPTFAERYASSSYETGDGDVVRGSTVLYSVTVPSDAENPEAGKRFVRYLLQRRDLLKRNGLIVRDSFPAPHGDVPGGVMP